jgi:Mn2+/Fe2+ NRAMP family transporter
MNTRIATSKPFPGRRFGFLAALGPGLIVMLADTDAGSIVTAAQSGAIWGYKLLLLQAILVPVLYVVQELTVRLGLVTQCGQGELIKRHFGRRWAWLSIGTLVIACVGALITELSGMASVGALFGVPVWQTMLLAIGTLIAMVWTASYRSVEWIAVGLGSFELAFLWIAFAAHPHAAPVIDGMVRIPFHDHEYLYLAAANIGAVIMPWMVFYQQSAVVEKGLNASHLRLARWETAIGAVATQLVMAAVLVAVAATIGRVRPETPLNTVQEISDSLIPFMGPEIGRVVFAFGLSGAALVATIVVSLTAAWGVGEVCGFRRSVADHPREAPWFYGIFTACLVLGGVLVASGADLVKLSVGIEVINALLLPVVLGFLYLLARKALPEDYRLKGAYAWIVGLVIVITSGFGVYAGIRGLLA